MIVAVATLLRYPLEMLIGGNLPFVLFYPAILLVARMAGLRPSLFSALLSGLSCIYLFPGTAIVLGLQRNVNGVLLFAAVAAVISIVGDRYRQREMRLLEFEKAMDGMDEGVIVVDRNYRYVIANRAFLMRWGLERDEVIGKRILDIIGPRLFEETIKPKLDTCFQGKIVQFEMHYTLPQAGESDLSVAFFPIEGPGGIDRVAAVIKDVTESKRAVAELRESEERFRLFVEHAPAALAMFDREMHYLHVSRRWRMDYALGSRELRGVSHYDVFPDRADRWKGAHRLALGGSVVRGQNDRFDRSDGTEQWVQWEVRPWFDLTGQIGGIIMSTENVTERNRADARMREYERVVEGLDEKITVLDREYRYVIANQAFRTYRDIEKEEILGHTVGEIMGEEYFATVFKPRMDECFAGNVVQYEFTYAYPNIGARDMAASYFPIEGPDGVDRIAIILQDITDRKRSEEALRRSEEEFRTMANAIPQLAWIANPDGWVYWFNDGWYQYTGTTPSEMAGWGWQTVHTPFLLPAVMDRWRESVATCKPFEMTYPLRGADGTYRTFLARATPLKDESGKLLRWFGTNTDIEEQKRAEDLLRSRGEELQALAARLQDVREEERTRVSRDLHDDIGQILTSVKMDLALILKLWPSLPAELHSRIKTACELLGDGVKTVRAICTGLRPSILDDLGLAVALEWQAKEFASRTHIECKFHIDISEARVDGKRATAIFRIAQEALTNVSRHAEASSVRMSLLGQNDEVVLTVEDDGKGFRDTREHNSLGIVGMKERAQACGGELQVSSTLAKGTTVTVRIPLGSTQDTEQEHASPDSR